MANAPLPLVILGASTRAAAFSALRAGLLPLCADLFADADLRARCPVTQVPPADYPRGLREVARGGPPGPWMYTGALENRPALVREIAADRPLWGNHANTLARVRSPEMLARLLCEADIAYPALLRGAAPTADTRWLLKPLRSAGGAGIRFWSGGPLPQHLARHHYLQEFIEGDSLAAVYVGDGERTRLLGLTHQLIGETWLHAGPFHYCGSIGPVTPPEGLREQLEWLGGTLAAGAGLRGLFAADLIVRDGRAWPVEVNPRYTASVEVLEYATGRCSVAWHRRVFDPSAPEPPAPTPSAGCGVVGKAVLFAGSDLAFPADGPWLATLREPAPVEVMPAFADIPHPAETIPAGRPILTLFAAADSVAGCLAGLKQIVRDLDQWLWAR
jgi:predicted ATP-grasp superfamily ATP-dependent carboligase